jgi:preprotein translocase SecE subunit
LGVRVPPGLPFFFILEASRTGKLSAAAGFLLFRERLHAETQEQAMAKQANMAEAQPNIFQRARNFLREVKTELGKVTWPTREDLQVSTRVTMYLLGGMAAIIFVFDQVFQFLILMLLDLAG